MNPADSFSDVIRFAQRMLAEKGEFCARGAPKLREIFARISREFDANVAWFGTLDKIF